MLMTKKTISRVAAFPVERCTTSAWAAGRRPTGKTTSHWWTLSCHSLARKSDLVIVAGWVHAYLHIQPLSFVLLFLAAWTITTAHFSFAILSDPPWMPSPERISWFYSINAAVLLPLNVLAWWLVGATPWMTSSDLGGQHHQSQTTAIKLIFKSKMINNPPHDPKTSINQQYGSDLKLNIFRPLTSISGWLGLDPWLSDPTQMIPKLLFLVFASSFYFSFFISLLSLQRFLVGPLIIIHPTQIWRSDPSRGYTWLALSNDSTCSHQLDTHSAGQCNDWYDRCRQMLKSVHTKWLLSSWWHEMSSVKACWRKVAPSQDTAVQNPLLPSFDRLKCKSPAALTCVLSFRLRDPTAAQFAAASGAGPGLQPSRVGPGHLGWLRDGGGGHSHLCSGGWLHAVHHAHRLLPPVKPLPRTLGHLLLSPCICLPCPSPQVGFGGVLTGLFQLLIFMQSGQHSWAAAGKAWKGSRLSTLPGFTLLFLSAQRQVQIPSGFCFPWRRLGDFGKADGWSILPTSGMTAKSTIILQ